MDWIYLLSPARLFVATRTAARQLPVRHSRHLPGFAQTHIRGLAMPYDHLALRHKKHNFIRLCAPKGWYSPTQVSTDSAEGCCPPARSSDAEQIPLLLGTTLLLFQGCLLTLLRSCSFQGADIQRPLLPIHWMRRGHRIHTKPAEPTPSFSHTRARRRGLHPLATKHIT